jgi:hypothetical protein
MVVLGYGRDGGNSSNQQARKDSYELPHRDIPFSLNVAQMLEQGPAC